MRNRIKFAVFTSLMWLISANLMASSFVVDRASSQVKWKGKKVTGEHYGQIRIQSGTVEVNGNAIAAAAVEMDMNSIAVEDLKDDGMNAKLVGHLKSDDFFSVEKFPSSRLVLTGVKALGNNEAELTGNLTIKGITHPVKFGVKTVIEGNTLKSSGVITVNRAKYDIRYGSGSFFTGLGDKMIYDDFTLDFSLVANKK